MDQAVAAESVLALIPENRLLQKKYRNDIAGEHALNLFETSILTSITSSLAKNSFSEKVD